MSKKMKALLLLGISLVFLTGCQSLTEEKIIAEKEQKISSLSSVALSSEQNKYLTEYMLAFGQVMNQQYYGISKYTDTMTLAQEVAYYGSRTDAEPTIKSMAWYDLSADITLLAGYDQTDNSEPNLLPIHYRFALMDGEPVVLLVQRMAQDHQFAHPDTGVILLPMHPTENAQLQKAFERIMDNQTPDVPLVAPYTDSYHTVPESSKSALSEEDLDWVGLYSNWTMSVRCYIAEDGTGYIQTSTDKIPVTVTVGRNKQGFTILGQELSDTGERLGLKEFTPEVIVDFRGDDYSMHLYGVREGNFLQLTVGSGENDHYNSVFIKPIGTDLEQSSYGGESSLSVSDKQISLSDKNTKDLTTKEVEDWVKAISLKIHSNNPNLSLDEMSVDVRMEADGLVYASLFSSEIQEVDEYRINIDGHLEFWGLNASWLVVSEVYTYVQP